MAPGARALDHSTSSETSSITSLAGEALGPPATGTCWILPVTESVTPAMVQNVVRSLFAG